MYSTIGDLTKLNFLYLADNLLTGTVPLNSFKSSNKDTMKVLALDDNALSGSIDTLWEFSNLEHVYLESNSFTGTIFPDNTPPITGLKTTMPNLITFDVSKNRLNGKLPNDIFSLSKLNILDLHGNVSTQLE